jgi:hypothetical protein
MQNGVKGEKKFIIYLWQAGNGWVYFLKKICNQICDFFKNSGCKGCLAEFCVQIDGGKLNVSSHRPNMFSGSFRKETKGRWSSKNPDKMAVWIVFF